jgi:hypothetical protein
MFTAEIIMATIKIQTTQKIIHANNVVWFKICSFSLPTTAPLLLISTICTLTSLIFPNDYLLFLIKN